jgi:hypothetical protein
MRLSSLRRFSSPDDGATHAAAGSRLLWCDVLRQVSLETEDALDRALARLEGAMQGGRVRACDLAELRIALLRMKGLGSAGQQIAGVAEGSVYGQTRRVSLGRLIHAVAAERRDDFVERQISCVRHLMAIDVVADDNLLRIFLRALIGWALDRSSGDVTLRLEADAEPGRAHLMCRFPRRGDLPRRSRFGGPANWGASWQLVSQTAQALRWEMQSGDLRDTAWLRVNFGCMAVSTLPAMEAIELDGEAGAAVLAQCTKCA